MLNYLEEGTKINPQRCQEHDAVSELELLVDCEDDKDCFDEDVQGAKDKDKVGNYSVVFRLSLGNIHVV